MHTCANLRKVSLFSRNSSHCQLPYWILFKALTFIAEELLQMTLHKGLNVHQNCLVLILAYFCQFSA